MFNGHLITKKSYDKDKEYKDLLANKKLIIINSQFGKNYGKKYLFNLTKIKKDITNIYFKIKFTLLEEINQTIEDANYSDLFSLVGYKIITKYFFINTLVKMI